METFLKSRAVLQLAFSLIYSNTILTAEYLWLKKLSKNSHQLQVCTNPVGSYLFKVNNGSTRMCEMCSKLTIKTTSFWCIYC